MKIDRLELVHIRMPLVHFFETSFGRVHDVDKIIVRAESAGVTGYGEVPASSAPLYSYETTQTAWHVIRDFLAARLKGREIAQPGPISELFSFVRGHNMAKAGIEMAVLDLFGKVQGRPLWAILGGEPKKEIPTGISLGIENSVPDLLRRVAEAIGKGYKRIKVKIKPKWDVEVVAALRKEFPEAPLMVDANAAYRLSDAEHLKRLDEFNLMMIEQPLDGEDVVDHAKLQAQLKTPICLDESIRSFDDARRALELGSCRIINIKQARVGGAYNAKMIHNIAKARCAPVWCGGLLESGVGRAHNLALATLPNFTLPGDISESARYFKEDVVDPPVVLTREGTLMVPQGPGIGYTVVESRLEKYKVKREYVLS